MKKFKKDRSAEMTSSSGQDSLPKKLSRNGRDWCSASEYVDTDEGSSSDENTPRPSRQPSIKHGMKLAEL
jgi:hypothetical protein